MLALIISPNEARPPGLAPYYIIEGRDGFAVSTFERTGAKGRFVYSGKYSADGGLYTRGSTPDDGGLYTRVSTPKMEVRILEQ